MAGVGSHAAAGSSGSYGNGSGGSSGTLQYHHHQYDSSGDYVSPSTSTSRLQASSGPSMRAMVMQQQSSKAYASSHRHAQASDDYEGAAQYASFSAAAYPERIGTPTGYPVTTPRADRDNRGVRDFNEGDNAFDFLLSPGLAPVGPISTSSSFGNLPPPLAPPPSQAPPPLPDSNNGLFSTSSTPSRPVFNRSQTAMPAPSTSGRAFQAPAAYTSQLHNSGYSGEHAQGTGLNSSNGPVSGVPLTGQTTSGQSNGRDFTPPPAISAKALLDIVLNLKADQPGSSQGPSASSSSANMSRSQSANATARLQQASQIPAHMRNISTGSNKSDEDNIAASGQMSGGLTAPSHPGMARTASSRNINDASSSTLRTVDLTHHRIAEVPPEVIDALEGTVGR